MYCPKCRSEYRAGFGRCATCDVDLVDRLPEETDDDRSESAGEPPTETRVAMVDYCGFLTLDEAREARDRLLMNNVTSVIAIRLRPQTTRPGAADEEFWLQIPHNRGRVVAEVLGYDLPDEDDESFTCSDCGAMVAADESFCAKCGARFE